MLYNGFMNNPCIGTTREWDIVELDEKIERAHNSDEIKWWKSQKAIIIRQSQDEGLEALRRELIAINKEEYAYMESVRKERDALVEQGEGEKDEAKLKALEEELIALQGRVDTYATKFKKRIKAAEKRINDYTKGKNYEDPSGTNPL